MIIIDKNAKREVQVKYPDRTRVLFPNLDDGYISSNDIVIPGIDAPISADGVGVASINDGAEGNAISKLVISIDPVQDLHGQSNPYPPGGGKNLCPIAEMNTTNGGYLNSSTGTIGTVVAGTQYTFSLLNNTTSTANLTLRMQVNGSWVDLASGNLVSKGTKSYTFTPENSGDVGISAFLGADYSPAISNLQLEKGSNATAYAPYSNICPISGWSEAKVTRSGDNSITDTYTIDLNGTRYGGTLDVTTGVLTVDRGYYQWNAGASDCYLTGTKAYALNKSDVVTINATNQTSLVGAICDTLPSGTWGQITNGSTSIAGCVYGNGLAFRIIGYTTATEYEAFLAEHPLTFVYMLKEPITVQLTPQEVTTLLGNNTISADCGNVLELSYSANMNIRLQDLLDEKLDKPTTPGTLGQVLTSDGEGSQTWETPE